MKATTIAISILALAACFGEARAQELDEPPAPAAAAVPIASLGDEQRDQQAADRALAERRQRMIDDCEQNHGSEIDCGREVETELRAEGLQSGSRVIHVRPIR